MGDYRTYNIGLDYGFLNNRIYGSVDYYQRHTKDLLNTINVISGTNYSSVITTNIGEMDNKGVEFAINAVPVHTKNWKWTVGMNYTWNDSEITKLNVIDSDANFVQTGAISGTGKTVQVFMVGQRPYTFYLAKQAYDDDGKPMEGQYVQPDGPSLPRKPNMLRTKAHCLLPIWDSIPSLLIRIGILPSADTGHSATMYTTMWLPTSMYNPCTAIRQLLQHIAQNQRFRFPEPAALFGLFPGKGQLLPY